MSEHPPDLIGSRPRWRPHFLREIEQLADEIGFIKAVQQTLRQDGIDVEVHGDFDQLKNHENGILFVGDHKNQWEFVALMDMLSKMNRDDMLNIAKFYVQRQVHQALGNAASRLVLPVYPRILASDRNEFFNSETLNRLMYKKFLLSKEESANRNTSALSAAVKRLEDGGIVNIFPTGSVVDSFSHPWRNGVGKIIADLDPDSRQDTLVSPYAINDISKLRLVGAVALKGRAPFGRPQIIDLHLPSPQTVGSIIESLHKVDRADPVAITERLRENFLVQFDPQARS